MITTGNKQKWASSPKNRLFFKRQHQIPVSRAFMGLRYKSKCGYYQHRPEAWVERCSKCWRDFWNMVKYDSKAHHENNQYPSTSRECLPYLHLGRQRGNPATVSVYDTAEHHEECGKYRSGNQQRIGVSSSLSRVTHPAILAGVKKVIILQPFQQHIHNSLSSYHYS